MELQMGGYGNLNKLLFFSILKGLSEGSFTNAGERTSTPTTTPVQSTASRVGTGPDPQSFTYTGLPAHCTYLKVISGEEKQHGAV